MRIREIFEVLMIGVGALLVTGILFVGGCGTGVGNPGSPNPDQVNGDSVALDFNAPAEAYEGASGIDCGSFTEASTSAEINAGRLCVREAFEDCVEARYQIDEDLPDGSRFASVVLVETAPLNPSACLLQVHTVSTDATRFEGDADETCEELSEDELPELACGIGD